MKRITAASFITIFVTMQSLWCYSFEVETHREMSRQAVRSSALDDFLRTQLNFTGGVDEVLTGTPIIEIVSAGSVSEDDGLRFLNHFHNPLRTWNQAGLLGSTLGASSIIWGQNPAQGFAWQNARDEYFLALTSTSQQARDQRFANTFRALGQLVHLVQDAGQPAHTRNDPHPVFKGLEGYVDQVRIEDIALFNSWINSPPVGFDPNILAVSPNLLAPIPVARIIDTTDPGQVSASPSAGTNQG